MEIIKRAELVRESHNWLQKNLEPGIDYGIGDSRSEKKVLLKPGAEKMVAWAGGRIDFRNDEKTWEMLGKPAGTVCFIADIYVGETKIGSGRGAETVGTAKRDANKSIKIAQKRALVDAVLYCFSMSDLFTQDSPAHRATIRQEKIELKSAVERLRTGVESELSTLQYITKAAKNYLHDTIKTAGAARRLRRAIEAGEIDLQTGEIKKIESKND